MAVKQARQVGARSVTEVADSVESRQAPQSSCAEGAALLVLGQLLLRGYQATRAPAPSWGWDILVVDPGSSATLRLLIELSQDAAEDVVPIRNADADFLVVVWAGTDLSAVPTAGKTAASGPECFVLPMGVATSFTEGKGQRGSAPSGLPLSSSEVRIDAYRNAWDLISTGLDSLRGRPRGLSDGSGVSRRGRGSAPAYASRSRRIDKALLEYRDWLETDAAQPTSDGVEAKRLAREDPFGFLLAVIFDQGILAAKAWRAPTDLKHRLGIRDAHLDPRWLRDHLPEVTAAVSRAPALHRYVNKIPQHICDAAARVCDEYDGDAARIWASGQTVSQVERRLREFTFIGQKKAAMAVEILLKAEATSLERLDQTDVAVDVQVRRVLLRTGIVDKDDPRLMIQAVRSLHPDEPGYLDLAIWRIGRQWCRPTDATCSDCAIDKACRHLLDRGANIK